MKSLIGDGEAVLHFRWHDPIVHDASMADVQPVFEGHLWLHLSLMYYKPWRPTFLKMLRDPSRDREGGLFGIDAAKGDELLEWKTVWEVWEDIPLDKIVECSWYVLVGEASATLEQLLVLNQLVTNLVPYSQMWLGYSHEHKAEMLNKSKKRKRPGTQGDN